MDFTMNVAECKCVRYAHNSVALYKWCMPLAGSPGVTSTSSVQRCVSIIFELN